MSQNSGGVEAPPAASVPVTDDTTPPWELEVFYDDDCPLCRRETEFLRRRDSRQRIRFTRLSDGLKIAEESGLSGEDLMAVLHARLPDGSWIRGMEVVRRMYQLVGWGWLTAITGWPLFRPVSDAAYRLFARNRLRLTGRCTDQCQVNDH